MINTKIISIEEYTDILIECKREYIVNESINSEMISMYKHHIKIIRKYTESALKKKRDHLYKECKLDLEKAATEIDIMENNIRKMDSNMIETVKSFFPTVANYALGFVVNYVMYNNLKKYIGKNIANKITINNAIWIAGDAALTAIKAVTDCYKEINKGSDVKNALNQYKNSIIKACEKTRKFINTEIKHIDVILKSNKKI